jgi:1,4-dihydroxy-2-naphthoate octaprenyltransferase
MALAPFPMGALLNLQDKNHKSYLLFFLFSLFLAIIQLLISAWIDLYDQNHGKLLDALEAEEGYAVIKTRKVNSTERKNYWRNIGIISNISLMILSLIMI